MGRTVSKRCLVISLLFIAQTKDSRGNGAAVFDVMTHKSLENVLTAASQSLVHLQSLSTEIVQMNSVLGSKLDSGWMQKIMQVGGMSSDFSSLLGSITGQGGDPLMQLNYLGVQHGGKQDFSNYIYAKNYFQNKFFPEHSLTNSTQLTQIRESKLEAIQVSTVDSLAISSQQKKTLKDDHQQLQNLKIQAEQNTSLQYQTTMQTRLLEHIAHQLDKIILIQSQQLELMATYMAQAQPTVFKKMSSPQSKIGK